MTVLKSAADANRVIASRWTGVTTGTPRPGSAVRAARPAWTVEVAGL